MYWGLVFSAFSASDVTMGTVGKFDFRFCVSFFFFFFLRIRGSVCSVGLAVGLACHGLGSVTFFFFFWAFFFFFFA